MIGCGLKIEKNCHVLIDQFHGNFRSKTLGCRKIRYVFRNIFRYRITNCVAVKMNIVLQKLFPHIQMYQMIPWKNTQIPTVVFDVYGAVLSPAYHEKWSIPLKGLAQAKIIKKSVILFRVLNMTI